MALRIVPRFKLEELTELVQSAGLQDLTEATWPAFQTEAAKLIGRTVDVYSRVSGAWDYDNPAKLHRLEYQKPSGQFKSGFQIELLRGSLSAYYLYSFSQPNRPVKFAFLKDGESVVGVCLQGENTNAFVLA